jgi:diguanylate cyclase (GGDEF)-like protein
LIELETGFDRRRAAVWTAAVCAIAAIAAVDYITGTEIRTFPLYYLPISAVAWHHGRLGAMLMASACAAAWLTSNRLAGMQYSANIIWVFNTTVQAASFATVGFLIATLRTVIARERALNRIDPLTSLLNGRAFYDDGQRLLSLCQRKGYPITVAYIDLDRFKQINDRLGHRAGDEVLREVGEIFLRRIRPSDLAARLGGDEFAMLLPATSMDEASTVLERLRLALSTAFESAPVAITGSIGAVTFEAASDNIEQLIHDADACMYAAKSEGGNRVRSATVSGRSESATCCVPAPVTPRQPVQSSRPRDPRAAAATG